MEGIFVLLGLAAVAAVLLGPAAFFLILNARRRIALLEAQRDAAITRIRKLERAVVVALEATIPPAPEARADVPTAAPPTAPAMESQEPDAAPGPWGAPVKDQAPEAPRLPPVVQAALLAGAAARDARVSPARAAAELDGAAPDETPPVFAQDNDLAKAVARTVRSYQRGGLEEAFGTRWAVWVGGVALAFGALLLVRYTIEQGFFGPGVRILMGAILAAALIAAGEFLRRQESRASADKFAVSIPAALTAAGTVAAFGTIYAAHALYGFIGSGPALVLLGATGVGAMFAAALHGPALAGLGLAGAFATPLLVETHAPTAWPVVIYLAVVAAAAYALAQRRAWVWLALTAAAGGALWGAALIPGYETASQPEFFIAKIVHILLQSALAGWFLGHAPQAGARDEDIRVARAGSIALAVFALLGMGALVRAIESGQDVTVFAGAAAALALLPLVIAYLAPAVATAALGAGATSLAAILLWPMSHDAAAVPGFFHAYPPIHPGAFQLFALCASAAVTGVTALRLWRAAKA